jgi:hypothetical protein
MHGSEAGSTPVLAAQGAVFAALFNGAVIAARACDASELRLAGPQLPAFVNSEFCRIKIGRPYVWTFTAATDAEPAVLHVSWPRQF